jgi:CheY-like chemotaxis protein
MGRAMTLHPSVLVGLPDRALRDRLVGWIRGLGYVPTVTSDGLETLAWLRQRRFDASMLDSGLTVAQGRAAWCVAQPLVGRRLVLMAQAPQSALWFEALRAGVAAVLPLPPEAHMVEAALAAAGCGGAAVPGAAGGAVEPLGAQDVGPRGRGGPRRAPRE